jgi:hypothetical protein
MLQIHPELATALLAEHGRDLHRRAERRRMLSGGATRGLRRSLAPRRKRTD